MASGNTMGDFHSDQILFQIRSISRSVERGAQRVARQTGLTAHQLAILHALSAMEEGTVSHIAKSASLSQTAASNVIDQLVRLDLVCRRRSPEDRRRVLVRMSPKGIERLSQALVGRQEPFHARFNRLQPWEQAMIASAIRRLSRLVEGSDDSPEPNRQG